MTSQTGPWNPVALASNGLQSESFPISIVVNLGNPDPSGLYIAPDGSDLGDGSSRQPLRTLREAAQRVVPGTTIYLRGGEYRNAEFGQSWPSRTEGSLVRVTTPGTALAPITLRPHGNEYARLKSDVTALALVGASYWTVQGLELAGISQTLNEESAMAEWWNESLGPTKGGGIQANRSDRLVVRDCIIHDFPDPGISFHGAEFLTVQGCAVYNNAWWSHGGTHGIVGSSMISSPAGAGQDTVIYSGNLVLGNQSLIISHVFSKGEVALTIDEGGGMHLQDTDLTFANGARVESNLAMFNGKAGLVMNTMDQVTLANNAFFQNAQVVARSAEVSLGGSGGSKFKIAENNLFQPLPDRSTFLDSTDAFLNIGANATTGTPSDGSNYLTVLRLPQVFKNPGAFDFTPATGVPAGMGLNAASFQAMVSKVREYGIPIQAPTQMPNPARQKAIIFSTWPASQSALSLVDKATGYTYTYAQRCHYPNPPGTTPCP